MLNEVKHLGIAGEATYMSVGRSFADAQDDMTGA